MSRAPVALLGGFAFLLAAVVFPSFFSEPLAFLTGWPDAYVDKADLAGLLAIGGLLIARFVRRHVVHGVLERRAGKTLPSLAGDIAGVAVVLVAAVMILTNVFGYDVTAALATGGLGLAVLGIALRDVILSVFTAAALNVESIFDVGDLVKIGDVSGTVLQTSWRSTTVKTVEGWQVSVPNVALGAAIITNYDRPDRTERRKVELRLDYSVSVESAERILLSGVLGAEDVRLASPPQVFAVRMDPDGVLYNVFFRILDHSDGAGADHAVIKSILSRLRDAGAHIACPKSEVVQADHLAGIADRTLDRLLLLKQCDLFRDVPEEFRHALAPRLLEHKLAAGAELVRAGDRRDSLFIVGEGLIRRQRARADAFTLREERFVATQALGRRALLEGLPHPGLTTAATASIVFELTRLALAETIAAVPVGCGPLASAFARAGNAAVAAETPSNDAIFASAALRLLEAARV